ncbi:MAG: 50S ribosomal protein L6 [Thermodesulfobacteriota bacterium]
MSRIGIKSIPIPDSVKVNMGSGLMNVNGPKGVLDITIPIGISTKIEDGILMVERNDNSKRTRSFHGLARSLIKNSIIGVTDGFTKVLQIIGTGYKAEIIGTDKIKLTLGYSHPIEFSLPNGVEAKVEDRGTTLSLHSIDKQLVGETAAKIRELRKPDAYKGKGVRYLNEVLRLKPGKAGAKK